MSYRPITDVWILARARLKNGEKYYGAYLGGFPERARALLGITLDDSLLHVCGGKAWAYPYARGFGRNDKTMDLDPAMNPDYVHDVREPFPAVNWKANLADPPYSELDATKYAPGADAYPKPNLLLRNCLDAVRVGGRVGFLHYILPSPPKNAHFVACVGVICGFNNRMRVFSVFERTA